MLNRSHSLFLICGLVFALGMAFAVALLCIPRAEDKPITETAAPYTSIPESEGTSPETEAPSLPVSKYSLAFRSLGDGTAAVAGIGSYPDSCVVIPEFAPNGDRVTEIAPRAFYGLSGITAIQIPASVRSIGALAFAACESLTYISVSASNESFCDVEGVLYTKDRTSLLLYPPMRAGTVAHITAETVQIADMAFFACKFLTRIEYNGSAAAWEAINIGSKNYSLAACAKEFTGTDEREI